VPREDNGTINSIAKNIKSIQVNKKKKFLDMLAYLEDKKTCRSQQLLAYFGEKSKETCGICEVCLEKKSTPSVDLKLLKRNILDLLKSKELTSYEICQYIPNNEAIILRTLQTLLEVQKIQLTTQNTYKSL
jgi:ATP-dependent DNA helicase RecQ